MGKKKRREPWRLPDDDDDGDDGDDGDDSLGNPFGNIFPFSDDGEKPEWFDDIFKNIMKQFKSKDFMNFSKNLFKNMGLPSPDGQPVDDQNKPKVDIKGPFVYGFSMRLGKDGKPVFEKFGNIKAPEPGSDVDEPGEPASPVREPLADIIDQGEEIIVVVELPGVNKEDIQLNATEHSIEIIASSEDRKYKKRMEMPGRINPDVAKARYTNGILEVRLQRAGDKPERGSTIPID